MIRRCLLILPLLLPVAARAQTPSFVPDFSKPDAASFISPAAENGVVSSPIRVEKQGKTLKMTSLAGGSFGVKLNVPPFDVDQLTRLSFDYTATPDAKINMFFRVNGNYYGVLFTGPKKVRAGRPIVYDTHATRLSGHIEIPLRAAIRSKLPTETSLRLDEILVGNWVNDGYMMAGIGGNGPGAAWTISNFKLEKADVKPTFGTAHFEGNELVIPAQNLDTVSFRNFPLKTSLGELPATYDPLREAFVYDAGVALHKPASTPPEPLRDGQSVDYTLHDDAGNVLNEGKATFHFAGLPVPSPPRLDLTNPDDKYPRVDFEDAAIPFGMDRDPNSLFTRDSENPYNGHWSASFTNPRLAGSFDFPAEEGTLDVATHPVITFAYRCDDRLRLDMTLNWNNQPYDLHFTDSDNPAPPRLGDFGAIRDGQWHLAQFNVLDALKKVQPNATDFRIANLMWVDLGWGGNVKGLQWWMDDLKWAPKTNGKLEGTVSLRDATGTDSVSYLLDQIPTTQADEKAEGGPKLSIDLTGKTGLWWLHIRAQNGANQWSDTAHYPIWCG